ncbi:MAG: NmrA family NAD(P)-binding protein [Chromatiaceae bacterium]|nr:NmrA family NAD(P)-binding protein [Chromatiaceae bacterium]MCF8004121.1 NmrA family NAD(P)-binding protein [Chromatiaceae bacterium]
MNTQTSTASSNDLVLVLGATGKTGRRIVASLKSLGVPVRLGSRSASPAFDWNNAANWDDCLAGVTKLSINYAPDLAMPGATDAISELVRRARAADVKHLVLLSGRGEAEALACEAMIQRSGLDWTIVRASWFNQNFSEGAFTDMVQAGQITLPDVSTPEPFVDVDDIAEVAVVALTQPGHAGELYEVTGPRMLTLAEVADELSKATGRTIQYRPVPHDAFVQGVADSGAPQDGLWMLDYLFTTVLDGRNAYLTDGVQRALGRQPKDFADFARAIAATETWKAAA